MQTQLKPGDLCVLAAEATFNGAANGRAPAPTALVVAVVGNDHWIVRDGPRLQQIHRRELMTPAEWKRVCVR